MGRWLGRAALPVVLAAGCGNYPPLPQVVVHAGQSIQAAIALMPLSAETWSIKVEQGVYYESLSVNRSGISLIGEVSGLGFTDRPVLDGTIAGGGLRQDGVAVGGPSFSMQGFTVRNYSNSGVTTNKTHDILLRDLVADRAGRYGFAPVESQDIVIDSCVATGLSEAGIYVSASQRTTVQSCAVYKNVAGIEVAGTVDAAIVGNESSGNTVGLLAGDLPGNPSPVGQNCNFGYNYVHDNNLANAGDPATLVGKIPAGIGIVVMAGGGTTVQANEIDDNHSVGVGIIGRDLLVTDPTGSSGAAYPDSTTLRNNNYVGNGKDPEHAFLNLGFMTGGDILWDGKGKGNCLDEPQGASLAKLGAASTLPACN